MVKSAHRIVIVFASEIKIIQRSGHQHISIGVEGFGKAVALMTQVILDLEFHRLFGSLFKGTGVKFPAKLLAHAIVGQISDVADHARYGQSTCRLATLL